MAIKITINDKTLADLGLEGAMLYWRQSARSEFTVRHAAAFDGEPLFAPDAAIVVKIGGVIIFQGMRVSAPASAEGAYEDYDYIFADAWYGLELLTFGQKWRVWESIGGGSPPASSYVDTSEINVFIAIDPDTNAITRVHNGDFIRQVVQWAIDHGLNLQIGRITPDLFIPVDHVRDIKCAAMIQMALKLTPDAVCEIDQSTTPPTFNCIRRSDMTAVNIALSEERITALKINRRDDLVVPAVVIKYKRTDEIDGSERTVKPVIDAAPPGATGFESGAILQTIDLIGGRLETLEAEISSELVTPANLADVNWWITHGLPTYGNPALNNLKIIPAARDIDALPYVLSNDSAGVAPWMKDDNGNPAECRMETFNALASYTYNGDKIGPEIVSIRLKTTNLASGLYSTIKSVEQAETAVIGLAAQMLAANSVVHHDGTITVTEEECGTDVKLSNTLNLTGGTNRYAAMGALVQEIAWDLEHGTRTFTIGWPKHLSIDDRMEITRFNRTRLMLQNPDLQASGSVSDSGDGLELPNNTPVENGNGGIRNYTVLTVGADNKVVASGDDGSLTITPKPGTDTASIVAKLSHALGRQIQLRELPFAERQQDGSCKDRWIIALASAPYEK